MWYNLHRTTEKISFSFLADNGPVYFTGGDIIVFAQVFIYKSFIMPRSKSVSAPSSVTNTSPCWYGLIVPGSTLIYGSNLNSDSKTSGFQKSSQWGGSYSLSKPRNNTAGYKNVLDRHDFNPPLKTTSAGKALHGWYGYCWKIFILFIKHTIIFYIWVLWVSIEIFPANYIWKINSDEIIKSCQPLGPKFSLCSLGKRNPLP